MGLVDGQGVGAKRGAAGARGGAGWDEGQEPEVPAARGPGLHRSPPPPGALGGAEDGNNNERPARLTPLRSRGVWICFPSLARS